MNYCAENPRLAGSHRTRPVWRLDMSGCSLQSCIGLYHFDLTLNSNLSASGHSTEPESGHFHLVAHLGSKYRMRPVLILDVSSHFCLTTPRLDKIPDASGHSVTSATNSFSTLSSLPLLNVPTTKCITLCTCVSIFSQMFSRVLALH